MSTVANIFLLHTDKPKHLNTERKILQDEIKLRKKPTITSLYDKCVLILSPVGLRTFSQQMTTLKHHFISQICSVPSRLSKSNADDQLRLKDLTINYLNYLSR